MSIISTDQRPPMRRNLSYWLRAVVSKFTGPDELQDIGRDEFEQIARDLNLSTAELYVLSGKAGLTGDLLKRRLAEFKLSTEFVRDRYPDVLRDLQRVCGNCNSSGRCAAEFDQATGECERSDYCPNTPTLQALKSEVEQEALATIPIGPCCC